MYRLRYRLLAISLMPNPKPDQITIPDWNFSCTGCGDCCRRWHVAISPQEEERLKALEWEDEDQVPPRLTTTINGFEYLAHTADGHCIFLDTEGDVCKIHRRFGYQAKPKGCRVYPFNISTTFPGEYSVIGRFDCQAVRANYGKPIAASTKLIRGYIDEMGLRGGFDRFVLDDLSEKEVKKITAGVFRQLISNNDIDVRKKLISTVISVDRLEKLGGTFLTQTDLDEVLTSFFARSVSNCGLLKHRKPNKIERWRFLNLFMSFLRRDEEMIGRGIRSRVERSVVFWRLLFRTGNLRDIGSEHPDGELTLADLFTTPIANIEEIDWSLYLDLIKLRLQSFQFFGPTNYDLSFYIGLKSLCFSFPLVIAAAKCSAMVRYKDLCCILPEDIDYAVGVIDHNLGRSALLGMGIFTAMIGQSTKPAAYSRLVYALLH